MRAVAVAFGLSAALNPARCCRFADRYSPSDFDSAETRAAFISEVVWSEREFYAKPFVGYDAETGLTYDGINLDEEGRISDPLTAPRVWTSASTESLQLALLALSIPGIRATGELPYPYTEAEAVALLEKKADTYETFHANYPYFGGWLPWLCTRGNTDGHCNSLEQPATAASPVMDWLHTLPGLDNGEYAWSVYTVARAAAARADQSQSPTWRAIALRYEALLTNLRESAVRIFLHDNQICEKALFSNGTFACIGPTRLNDPFEGELMVLFIDLLGNWSGYDQKNVTAALWAEKQKHVESASLYGVTVQKGYYFSAHEQWKMLVLPYLDLPKTREILTNGEVARTRYSLIMGVPGLFSAANKPMPDEKWEKPRPGCPSGYCKAVGVPPLAQAPVEVNWTVSPYGAFPLTLVDQATGLSWYNAMLRTPRMQTMIGGGEAVSTDGQEVASILTWDTKATMVVAMYGGLGPLLRPFLEADGAFDVFKSRVEGMYVAVFGPVQDAPGGQIPGRPHLLVDSSHPGYASCACTVLKGIVSVFMPLCGLYVALVGGHFLVTTRVLIGAVAGAIPGAKLNFVYAVSLCSLNPRPESLTYCQAVDDPVASAVLLGLFGAILGAKSLKFTLVLLVGIDAALGLAFVSLALPVAPRTALYSFQAIGIALGVAVLLSLGCLWSCVYKQRSRALTGWLTALLAAGMLTMAIWSFEDLDVFDPVWAGSDEGFVAPLLVWLGLTTVSAWWQLCSCTSTVHQGEHAGDCEGVREARFHKSNSLPDVRSADTNGHGQPLLDQREQRSLRDVPRNQFGSTGSLAGLSEGSDPDSRTRSVPDLQRLLLEAQAAQNTKSIDVGVHQYMPPPAPASHPHVFEASDHAPAEGLLAPHKESAGAKLYLWCSVLLTLSLTAMLPFTIDWLTTNLVVGLIYCFLNWFLLWNVTDMFISTVAYHLVRLIWGFTDVPRMDLLKGIPNTARTLIQFCLLSDNVQTSQDTWENAYDCFMKNVDCNGNIAVCLVSVTNKLSVVEAEVEACHALQQRFLQQMMTELDAFLTYAQSTAWPPPLAEVCPTTEAERHHLSPGVVDRWYFWTGLANKVYSERSIVFKAAKEEMRIALENMSKDICYFHRNSRVLKKPGQYQDMMILAATGDNKAYTYTDPAYGKLGRPADSSCFGFTGNIVNDVGADLQRAVKKLQKRGEPFIQRMKREGQLNPFRYSMVMDSDTVSEWRAVLRLIEYAVVNPTHGIFQPALALDDEAEGQTWYMWAESLRNASAVNLPKAHFTIFGRHGFYGKGLFDNQMMINSVIGRRPEPESDGTYRALEALPVDIMSHDTFEAKILKPCYVPCVKLREEPAKNAISSFPQTTRWMVGEVRNASYPPGLFRSGITLSQRMYGFFNNGEAPRVPFIRQFDIPVAWSTDYISHISFRVMHAGPAIMTIILLRNYCVHLPGVLSFRNNQLAIPLTIFTILSLFVLPKGLLVLDMLPSLGLAKRWRQSDLLYEPSAGAPRPRPPRKINPCALFFAKLLLSVAEAVLSALIFGPECLVGLHRMVLAYMAQITGKVSWRPQAAVDKEVEERTTGSLCDRFRYVVSNVWHIPAMGLVIALTSLALGILEPFSVILWLSWLVHPFVVTWGCSPCPEPERSMWVSLVRRITAEER